MYGDTRGRIWQFFPFQRVPFKITRMVLFVIPSAYSLQLHAARTQKRYSYTNLTEGIALFAARSEEMTSPGSPDLMTRDFTNHADPPGTPTASDEHGN